jgi:hypothetical protein
MPSSSDQTRVGRPRTLRGGAASSLEGRDIELSVSPYDLCANRSDRRQSREGDRWFESTSLQRRVCEPSVPGGSVLHRTDAERPPRAPQRGAGVERSFDPLPVMAPLQICRRLKLGAGQRVEDAKFRQRHDVIEAVGDAPPDASLGDG